MEEMIGYMGGICTAICFLPQTLKTIITRNVKGLSLISYLIYELGLVCWIYYGVYLKSLPMVIFNTISLAITLPIVYTIIRYNKKNTD